MLELSHAHGCFQAKVCRDSKGLPHQVRAGEREATIPAIQTRQIPRGVVEGNQERAGWLRVIFDRSKLDKFPRPKQHALVRNNGLQKCPPSMLRGSTIMKTPPLTRSILAVAFSLGLIPTVYPQTTTTNASIFPELPYAATVNREVDFMRSLLEETNRAFDQKVYMSVKTNANKPMVISYHLVSFIFYYPTGVAFAASATEMAQPDELVCTKEGILRKATTNEIPANYVRILDTHRKNVRAELDLLLGVAPIEKPEDAKFIRRSFRFVYQNAWKVD